MQHCDGKGPLRHSAGECPWCDQEMFNENVDREIAEAHANRLADLDRLTRASEDLPGGYR